MITDPLAAALSAGLEAAGSPPDPDTLAGYLADALSGLRLPERSALVWAFRSGRATALTAGEIGPDQLVADLTTAGHGLVARGVVDVLVSVIGQAERRSTWRAAAVRAASLAGVGFVSAERSAEGRIRRLGVLLPVRRGEMRYAEVGRVGAPEIMATIGSVSLVGDDLPAIATDLRALGCQSADLVDLHETADWLVSLGRIGNLPSGLGLASLATAVDLPVPQDLRSSVAAVSIIWLSLLRPAIPTD